MARSAAEKGRSERRIGGGAEPDHAAAGRLRVEAVREGPGSRRRGPDAADGVDDGRTARVGRVHAG